MSQIFIIKTKEMRNILLNRTERYLYSLDLRGPFDGKINKIGEKYYIHNYKTDEDIEIPAPPGYYFIPSFNDIAEGSIKKVSSLPQMTGEEITITVKDGDYTYETQVHTFTLSIDWLPTSGYCNYWTYDEFEIYSLYTGSTSSATFCGVIENAKEFDQFEDADMDILIRTRILEIDGHVSISQSYNSDPSDATSSAKNGLFVESVEPGVDYNRETGKVFYNKPFPKLINDVYDTSVTLTWEEVGIDDKLFQKYLSKIKSGHTSPKEFNVMLGDEYPTECHYYFSDKQKHIDFINFTRSEKRTRIDALGKTVTHSNYPPDSK